MTKAPIGREFCRGLHFFIRLTGDCSKSRARAFQSGSTS